MNTDTHTNGSTVKNHISLKPVFGYSAMQRTSFRSWFLVYQRVLPQACFLQHPWHIQGRKLIILRLPQPRLLHQPWHLQLCQERKELGDCWPSQPKSPKPNKNEDLDLERRDLLNSDIPEWLQELREILVDDRVPERRDSHGSSSHVPSLEPTPARSADLGKQCFILTHRKTEIARSVRGPKSQGLRAEDALSESYLVQKTLVIWLQQITRS